LNDFGEFRLGFDGFSRVLGGLSEVELGFDVF